MATKRKALTLEDLLEVVKQEKLTPKAKIFLSIDEEGNEMYGLASFGIEKGELVLYPSNTAEYRLSDW